LSASAYKLPEVREELFQLLYKQIEQAGSGSRTRDRRAIHRCGNARNRHGGGTDT